MTRCAHCGSALMTWNRDAVLAAVREWAKDHGKPPTSKQWRNGSPKHPAQSTVSKMFGSWNALIAAAGFEPNKANWQKEIRYSREQILHEILEFRFRHGRLPTYREFSAPDPEKRRPSSRTIVRLFGSWNGAILAAGYEPLRRNASDHSYRARISAVTKRAA